MAEFVDVVKEAYRMCDFYHGQYRMDGCEKCPIYIADKRCHANAPVYLRDGELEEFEATVLEWSKQHPK